MHNIIVDSVSIGGFASEANAVGISLNYGLTGGSFSISMLRNRGILPEQEDLLTLPLSRVGVVKGVGTQHTSGGLLVTVTGVLIPLVAQEQTFVGLQPPFTEFANVLVAQLLKAGGSSPGQPGVFSFSAQDFPVKNFIFRGIALQGIQSLASNILAEVVVARDRIHVTRAGKVVGPTWSIPKAELIGSSAQNIDFSLDKKAVINPVLVQVNLIDEGVFIFDDEHAQKQPPTQIIIGAPGGSGLQDFVPIPDGLLVEGTFDEWNVPVSGDLSNPSPTPTDGRYWKVFPSPTFSGRMRGIVRWSRIIKDLSLGDDVASFIGSPITKQTEGLNSLGLLFGTTQSGITGFTAVKQTVIDIISGRVVDVEKALVITPPGLQATSGLGFNNFYNLQFEIWTFPRVAPTIFPGAGADPLNPFGIPDDAVVVNPSSAIVPSLEFYNYYLQEFKRINSPRLRTQVSQIYTNAMPQPGDHLIVDSLPIPDCGRISTVTLSYSRGGVRLDIVAERFDYGNPDEGFVVV